MQDGYNNSIGYEQEEGMHKEDFKKPELWGPVLRRKRESAKKKLL